MQKQIFILTGSTGVIGEKIAEKIALNNLNHLVLLGRNEDKCKILTTKLKEKTKNPDIEYEIVDLSLYSSVKSFVNRYKKSGKRIDVLINNAAITTDKNIKTAEGLELQFAVNIMSYFWMMREFQDVLIASAPSRVVNVASNYAGDMDLKDLQFERRSYSSNTAYRQSKQANRMLTVAFAEQLASSNVAVNACHPGVVTSATLNGVGIQTGWESPEKGAETPLMLATEDIGQNVTGKFFSSLEQSNCPFGQQKDEVNTLFQYCENLTLSLEKNLQPE